MEQLSLSESASAVSDSTEKEGTVTASAMPVAKSQDQGQELGCGDQGQCPPSVAISIQDGAAKRKFFHPIYPYANRWEKIFPTRALFPPPIQADQDGRGEVKRNLHPLLMNEVLKNLFSYFEGDSKANRENLCRFREVCKDWNEAVSPVMKRSVTWRISSTWLKAGAEDSKKESYFLNVLTESKSDIFRTFTLFTNNSPEGNEEGMVTTIQDQLIIQKFISLAGEFIVVLNISALKLGFVNEFLRHLPNLEHLEMLALVGTWWWGGGTSSAYQEIHFPKLKTAVFRHPGPGINNMYLAPQLVKQVALIHCSVLENSPQLTTLQLDMLQNLDLVLACRNLENLTALVLYSYRINCGGSRLQTSHLATISAKCPHLIKFAADVDQNDYGLILDFVANYAHQLEDLALSNLRFEDSPQDDEAGKGPYLEYTWPPCPALKKLYLRDWNLHNNFNLVMPNLRIAELNLLECKRPFVYPVRAMRNVYRLTLGDLRLPRPFDQMMDAKTIGAAGRIFPNVRELSVLVKSDEGLRAIYRSMPGLERLTLELHHCCFMISKSVTDCGITGLTSEQLQQLAKAKESGRKKKPSAADVSKMRSFPFIGDLKGLQYFACENSDITKASILYGLAALTELNSVRLDEHLRADCDAIMGRKVAI